MLLLIVFEADLVSSLDVLPDAVEAEEKLSLADLTPEEEKRSFW